MSPLPKHLRPRWRYLAVEVTSWPDSNIDRREFQRELWRASRGLHGDVGSARENLRVYGFSFEHGYGEAVVRVGRSFVSEGRAALATIDRINDHPVGTRVTGVSGTVRGCEEKYLGRRPEPKPESTVVYADASRPAVVAGNCVDIRLDDTFVGATSLDLG